MRLLFVLVLAVLISATASAQPIYSPSGVVGTTLQNGNYEISTGQFKFISDGNGLVRIFSDNKEQGTLGLAITGTVNSAPQTLTSWQTNWAWQVLSATDNNVTLLAQTNYSGLVWYQRWNFQANGKAKLTNTLINNTGFDISNTNFYYALDLNDSLFSNITVNDQNISLSVNNTITNLTNYRRELSFASTIFGFQDLVDNGYTYSYLFSGNLSAANAMLPNSLGVIVGVTKNGGLFPNGAIAQLDPTISTKSTATSITENMPNPVHVNSENLVGCLITNNVSVKAIVSTNGGSTWDTSTFDLNNNAAETGVIQPNAKACGVAVNHDTNMVVFVWADDGDPGGLHTTQGDWDNNLLVQGTIEIPLYKAFGGGFAGNSGISLDTNSGNFMEVTYLSSFGHAARSRLIDLDKNVTVNGNYILLDINLMVDDVNIFSSVSSWLGDEDGNLSVTTITGGFLWYSNYSNEDSGSAKLAILNCNAISCATPSIIQHPGSGNSYITTKRTNGTSNSINILKCTATGTKDCLTYGNWGGDLNLMGNTGTTPSDVGKTTTGIDNNRFIYVLTNKFTPDSVTVGYAAYVIYYDENNTAAPYKYFDSNFVTSTDKLSFSRRITADANFFPASLIDGNVTPPYVTVELISANRADLIAPTTTDDANKSTWQNFNATITLACTDTFSGCSVTKYRLDSDSSSGVSLDAWLTYSGAFTISTDGNHVFDYNSTDTAGNIEATHRSMALVDKTNPATVSDANSGWRNTDQNVHLTCTDANSGCSVTKYRLDNGAWASYSASIGIVVTTDLNHIFDFNSTDIAGNIEATHTTNVAKDANGSVITHKFPDSDISSATNNLPTFTFKILDTLSGAKTGRFHYFKDGLVVGTYNRFCDVNSDGWCNFTVPSAFGEDNSAFIQIDIISDNIDNNSAIDVNTGIYTYDAVGATPPAGGNGGGGGSGKKDTITIISPTGAITLSGYPGYRNKLTFTIKNETNDDRVIYFTFDETIGKFFTLPTDTNLLKNSQKNFVLDIEAPEETILNIYTGSIEITDNSEKANYDFTLDVGERDFGNLAIGLLSGEVFGIPNIVLIVVVLAITGIAVLDTKSKKKIIHVVGG